MSLSPLSPSNTNRPYPGTPALASSGLTPSAVTQATTATTQSAMNTDANPDDNFLEASPETLKVGVEAKHQLGAVSEATTSGFLKAHGLPLPTIQDKQPVFADASATQSQMNAGSTSTGNATANSFMTTEQASNPAPYEARPQDGSMIWTSEVQPLPAANREHPDAPKNSASHFHHTPKPKPLPPPVPPDENTIKQRLSVGQTLPVGLRYGVMFGMLAGLPIWGMQRLFNKGDFFSETLTGLKRQLENAQHRSVAAQNLLPLFTKIVERLPKGNKFVSFGMTLASATMLGLALGGSLSLVYITHLRDRLITIRRRWEDTQGNGGFGAPPPPNPIQKLLIRLGVMQPPVTDPHKAYQQMVETDLSSQNAFMNGFKTVLFVKILMGVFLPLGTALSLAPLARHAGFPILEKIMHVYIKPQLLLFRQPLFLTKIALAPVMGGLIAQQLAPWAKSQLGKPDPSVPKPLAVKSGKSPATL